MSDERRAAALRKLEETAETGSPYCGSYIASLDPLHRTELLQALLFERLERKMRMVEQLRAEAGDNWNQTFYLLYFRTLGDRQNQEAYLELARRVPYRILLRERTTPRATEAMLLGASGLLDLYANDSYTLDLKREYVHFASKYNIEQMAAERWVLHEVRPANHPVLRLAQAAEFFRQDELMMERVMACRDEEAIQRLFCIEASPYWRTHYTPNATHDQRPKRIGHFKAQIIGINLVTVLQFAYGSLMGNERLRDSALTLFERLPAEDNRYMRLWRSEGLRPRDAYESQALLQLITEHCLHQRCSECRVAHRMLDELLKAK